MPRTARVKSPSQIYHVMLRGIDKRNIFLDKYDYYKFLHCIYKAREKKIFHIYAYCLMTNHVHILLKCESEEIGEVIRRITSRYVPYHNKKYGRRGHLFENRFKSEPIGDDRYFLTVLRYIHQNPIKAGLADNLISYPYSSYLEYMNEDNEGLINKKFVLDMFSNNKTFENYMLIAEEENCLDDNGKQLYSDDKLKELISSKIDIDKLSLLDIKNRNYMIKKIKDSTGASNRQLARVLNLGRRIIDKAN